MTEYLGETMQHPVLFTSVQSHVPQRDDEIRVHRGQILRLLRQRSGWAEVLYRDQVGWCPLVCLGDQMICEKESLLLPSLVWDWVRVSILFGCPVVDRDTDLFLLK